MMAYMLKGRDLAPYYGLYAHRADAMARCGALDLTDRYTVVRVSVTEVPARRAITRRRRRVTTPVLERTPDALLR